MSKSHPKVKAPTDKPTGPSGVPGLSANTTGTKAAAARAGTSAAKKAK